jgi:hypothetical protein
VGRAFPSDQILQIGHSVELSRKFSWTCARSCAAPPTSGFSRASAWPRTPRPRALAGRGHRLGHGELEKSGEYNAAGVTSSIAGKGFHLGVLDDAQSEQDKDSKITKDRLANWWGPGFYTRRMPERNAILINATRWGTDDLPGRVLEMNKKIRDMATSASTAPMGGAQHAGDPG